MACACTAAVNLATQFVAGRVDGGLNHTEARRTEWGCAGEALVRTAMERLDDFAFVGLFERMGESVDLLAHEMCCTGRRSRRARYQIASSYLGLRMWRR